jgi:hemoglobin
MTPAERRDQIIDDIVARTGLDESVLDRLVRAFCSRVRADALLGPVFEARVVDWEPHLQRMTAFRSSVALMSGRYHGQPTAKHLPLPVGHEHFARWLALFEATAHEVCSPAGAAHVIERAHPIARSIEMAMEDARAASGPPRLVAAR